MGKPVATADDSILREVLGMQPRSLRPALTTGQILDDTYRIDGEIGAGGMGRVYRARDTKLGRDVAIKLHAVGGATSQRLVREAAALAKLAHPNVVTVHAVGAWAGHPWVAMEYVPGGTARDWVGNRTAQDIVALYADAGLGLVAAHDVGLVHRDFKPDNVLVGRDDRPRVADFGLVFELEPGSDDDAVFRNAPTIPPSDDDAGGVEEQRARELDSDGRDAIGNGQRRRDVRNRSDENSDDGRRDGAVPRRSLRVDSSDGVADTALAVAVRVAPVGDGDTSLALSKSGFIVGTPAYMAPEQWTGAKVTPAADQFALAVSLWEALTGARPFRGESGDELLDAMVREVPAPPAGKIPHHIERALRRALAFAPEQRWPSMSALIAELRRPPSRARTWWIAAGAGALVASGALAFAVTRTGTRDDDCANEVGLPSQLDVELAASHARSARVDGNGNARRVLAVADALRGEDRRLASSCSDDGAMRTAARACRAHAGRVAATLFAHAHALPPSETLALVLDHPQLATCAEPWLSASPVPEPAAQWALAELDAARVLAEHGALARARGVAAAAEAAASDPLVARRLELTRAAIAIAEGAPLPAVAPADSDDAVTTLIVDRLAIQRAAVLRRPADLRAAVAVAERDVDRLASAAPEQAYRTTAAAVVALDEAIDTSAVAQHARLAKLPVVPPIPHDDAALAFVHTQQFVDARPARVNGKELIEALIERWGIAHPRVAAAQLELAEIPTFVSGPPELTEPHRLRTEGLAKIAAAEDGGAFIAQVNYSLGRTLTAKYQSREAEPFLLAAHRGFVQTLGPDHLEVAIADLDRVHGLHARREHAAAEAMMLRAQRILEPILGDKHPLVGIALDNRAVAVRGRGDLPAAIALWRSTVEVTRAFAGESRHAANAYDRARIELARTYVMNRAWQLALDTLEPVVKGLQQLDDHDLQQARNFAIGALEAGKAFLELGRHELARIYLNHARSSLGIQSWDATRGPIGRSPETLAEIEAVLARLPPEQKH